MTKTDIFLNSPLIDFLKFIILEQLSRTHLRCQAQRLVAGNYKLRWQLVGRLITTQTRPGLLLKANLDVLPLSRGKVRRIFRCFSGRKNLLKINIKSAFSPCKEWIIWKTKAFLWAHTSTCVSIIHFFWSSYWYLDSHYSC